MSPLQHLWDPINLSALKKTSQTEMKCVSLHTSEAKPPTGQPSDLIQLPFYRATSHCDRIAVVVVLRVLPFKVHSFHPAEANTLRDPDPFSFVPRDPLFSPIQP